RFVPVSGRSGKRLVLVSYGIAVALCGISATIFIVFLGFLSPSLESTLDSSALATIYVVATMFWVIFVLQDAVLIGLRRAPYVLVENTVFGVVKISLLVVFASVAPKSGIFLSWTIPLAAVVLVVNVFVFGRFLPEHAREELEHAEPMRRQHVSRY